MFKAINHCNLPNQQIKEEKNIINYIKDLMKSNTHFSVKKKSQQTKNREEIP